MFRQVITFAKRTERSAELQQGLKIDGRLVGRQNWRPSLAGDAGSARISRRHASRQPGFGQLLRAERMRYRATAATHPEICPAE
jgi:hypothetical protein